MVDIPINFDPLSNFAAPPELWPVLGYHGQARFVGLYWTDDGSDLSGAGHAILATGYAEQAVHWSAFLMLIEHPVNAAVLGGRRWQLGSGDAEATAMLVIDRQQEIAWLAPLENAPHFLETEQISFSPPALLQNKHTQMLLMLATLGSVMSLPRQAEIEQLLWVETIARLEAALDWAITAPSLPPQAVESVEKYRLHAPLLHLRYLRGQVLAAFLDADGIQSLHLEIDNNEITGQNTEMIALDPLHQTVLQGLYAHMRAAGQIARECGLKRLKVTKTLQVLARLGLVCHEQNAAGTYWCLTPAGQRMALEAHLRRSA